MECQSRSGSACWLNFFQLFPGATYRHRRPSTSLWLFAWWIVPISFLSRSPSSSPVSFPFPIPAAPFQLTWVLHHRPASRHPWDASASNRMRQQQQQQQLLIDCQEKGTWISTKSFQHWLTAHLSLRKHWLDAPHPHPDPDPEPDPKQDGCTESTAL